MKSQFIQISLSLYLLAVTVYAEDAQNSIATIVGSPNSAILQSEEKKSIMTTTVFESSPLDGPGTSSMCGDTEPNCNCRCDINMKCSCTCQCDNNSTPVVMQAAANTQEHEQVLDGGADKLMFFVYGIVTIGIAIIVIGTAYKFKAKRARTEQEYLEPDVIPPSRASSNWDLVIQGFKEGGYLPTINRAQNIPVEEEVIINQTSIEIDTIHKDIVVDAQEEHLLVDKV